MAYRDREISVKIQQNGEGSSGKQSKYNPSNEGDLVYLDCSGVNALRGVVADSGHRRLLLYWHNWTFRVGLGLVGFLCSGGAGRTRVWAGSKGLFRLTGRVPHPARLAALSFPLIACFPLRLFSLCCGYAADGTKSISLLSRARSHDRTIGSHRARRWCAPS